MNRFYRKILNIGVQPDIDYWAARRISITNSVVVISLFIAAFSFLFSVSIQLPYQVQLIIGLALVFPLATLVLNFYYKTITARMFFIILANLVIVCTSILTGPEFNYQYFTIAILGLPFLFFKDEIGKLRLLFSILPILIFIFLEFYFANYKPALFIEESYI